jgi:hypothetical protein
MKLNIWMRLTLSGESGGRAGEVAALGSISITRLLTTTALPADVEMTN